MAPVARFASSLENFVTDQPWKPYVLAVVAVFVALVLREALTVTLGINLFAVFFLPAVMVTGLACALVPGIFAAVLATFAPLIHVVGDTRSYFPSHANMVANLTVIGIINIGLAIVAASHRSYRKRVELAMRELNHRTKNLLSVIISIAHRIAKSSSDIGAFENTFTDRLRAMMVVNDLLVKNEWKDMPLRSAVEVAISPFSPNKISIAGSDLMASPVIVENIMMALHELLTNSAKYGSLATNFGKIRITWREEGNRLRFSWHGTGLHDGQPASRKGFGTLMLTEVVPRTLGGQATYEIKNGEVLWVLEFPLTSKSGHVQTPSEVIPAPA
jgi:two-component sensor histidine kinase